MVTATGNRRRTHTLPKRIGVLVAGMHRAGTSAVTRVLNLLGADLPGNLIPPVKNDNERGFWESVDVARLNDRILESVGQVWHSIDAFPQTWYESGVCEPFKHSALELLQRDLAQSSLFVLKDPRLCRFLPFWTEVLERFATSPQIVIPIRNPVEVAMSLHRRNGLSLPRSLLLWLRHCLDAERDSRGYPRAFVAYESLLADWRGAMQGLASRLNLPLLTDAHAIGSEIDEFLTFALKHNEVPLDELTNRQDIASWIKETYAELLQLCTSTRATAQVRTRLDSIRSQLDTADTLFAPVLYEQQGHGNRLKQRLEGITNAHEQPQVQLSTKAAEIKRLGEELSGRKEQLAVQGKEIGRLSDELAARNALLVERDERLGRLELELEASRRDLTKNGEELSGRKEQLAVQGKEIGRLSDELAARNALLVKRDAQLGRLELKLEASRRDLTKNQARIAAMVGSKSWRLTAPLRGVKRALFSIRSTVPGRALKLVYWLMTFQLPRRLRMRKAARTVAKSGLFDSSYYLAQNPDVAAAGVNPLVHYLAWGAAEGRDPHPLFDSSFYLEQNPDVAESGTNPLVHYLQAGAQEGRNPSRTFDTRNYLHLHPEVRESGVNPLIHYARHYRLDARAPRAARPASDGHHLTVALIAWDAGHNPVGRAYMLAEALSRRFKVVLLAPQFPKYGSTVWEPLRDSRIPIITFPGRNFPEFGEDLERIAQRLECDAIIACKARMPSLELGLLAKSFRQRPLIVDVDDLELSFFKHQTPLGLLELQKLAGRSELLEPYGEAWTRFAETLVPHADAVLVSNMALQRKFGGTLVSHARDETLYDPALYDRAQCRRAIGLNPKDKVIFFSGTVRRHKGVVELAEAVRALGDPTIKLCVLGRVPDRGLESSIRAAGGDQVVLLPTVSFREVPRVLVAADLVCCLQDPDSEVSRYQLPVKIVDALALGIPVLATETAPLRPLIEAGAVMPVAKAGLADALRGALQDRERLCSEQLQRRNVFLSGYCYEAVVKTIEPLILDALKRLKPLADKVLEFRNVHRKLAPQVQPAGPAVSRARRGSGRHDVVMLWKQNDLGIYGRRVDMLAKYLSRHPDVRQVVLQDKPICVSDMWNMAHTTGVTQARAIYQEIVARRLGLRDQDNLTLDTFIYSTYGGHRPLQSRSYPPRNHYLKALESTFRARGIDSGRAIFWVFPVNEWLTQVIRRFRPRVVVCDVVDDERRFPGLTPEGITMRENNFREVLPLADLVLTNCEPVQQAMSAFATDVRVLPNAAELEPPGEQPDEQLERLLAIPKPRLGYVGNLESKIDIPLLEHVATHRPDWHIVLVGSTHANPGVLSLDRFPNVHFMGVVQYEKVRLWIQHFDVALVPHLDTELTRSMHPLKVFVYLAARVPVVATRVPNLGPLEQHVRIADSPDNFVRQVDQALDAGRLTLTTELDTLLQANSWPARIEQAMAWIEEAAAKRRA